MLVETERLKMVERQTGSEIVKVVVDIVKMVAARIKMVAARFEMAPDRVKMVESQSGS